MQNIVTISLSPEENIVEALEEVLRLAKQGYTSGYTPNWSITEEE